MNTTGAILVISGPSGSGKSSLCAAIFQQIERSHFSISTTTRPMRENEQHGRDYFFVSREEFMRGVEQGNFLEWAEVHGNLYGTSRKRVIEALSAGDLVVFDIDVQGQENIQRLFPNHTTSCFITTPCRADLERRLRSRGTDSEEHLLERLNNAQSEMRQLARYDYLIINDDLARAREELVSVAMVARLKTALQEIGAFLHSWEQEGR